MSGKLELRALRKLFGGETVVRDVSLGVDEGEFVALLGPSGCGKSTTLNIIAGFEKADAGEVLLDGKQINDVAPQHRRIGWVPQDFGVFSRLTVAENLEFGLRRQGVPGGERKRRLAAFAERLGLGAIWHRRGGSLNLSDMQLVALARSLITGPAVMLLDEPMSNLDAAIRTRLRTELKQIQKEFGQTVIYVTHDQVEAMAMADRIAVMGGGAIAQAGAPLTLYRHPVNRFVASFLGEPAINLLSGDVRAHAEGSAISLQGGGEVLIEGRVPAEGALLLGIRPHEIGIGRVPARFSTPMTVAEVEYQGAEEILSLAIDRTEIRAIPPHGFARPGDVVATTIRAKDVLVFDPATGLAIHAERQRRAA